MMGQKKIMRWVLATFVLLLLFLLPDGCTARAKGLFKNWLTPIQSGFLKGSRSLKAGADSVRGFGGLAEENLRLREELVEYQAKARLNDDVKAEVDALRAQLKFRDTQASELIAAEIAARSINGWWQSVRLAKGFKDGVVVDRAVISPDGLIGRTVEVSGHTAEVLLLSDPACKVSARVSRTGSPGLVTGGGVNLKGYPVAQMQFIFKDAPVQVGDEVVTSGLGGIFPRDISIGYIESIQMEEGGLYQVAKILPKAVIHLTDVVFVTAGQEDAE